MADPFARIADLIRGHQSDLAVPGVLSVRPGYAFHDSWITDTLAIVVTVDGEPGHPVAALPDDIEGVPVDVRPASERKAMQVQDPARYARTVGPAPDLGAVPAFASEFRVDRGVMARFVPLQTMAHPAASPSSTGKPELDYTPPPGASLAPIDLAPSTPVTLSASPDSGWPTLSAFLAATTTSLTVGMYDFTSSHVLETVEKMLAGKTVKIVLDHPSKNPTADQTDEQTAAALASSFGADLEQAWALDRMDPLAAAWVFPTAYHIKVAVRDSTSVWVSSGNWNNSNQPDIDPVTTPGDAAEARTRDRDWHVVVNDPGLARTFEAFLLNDLAIAEAHDVAGAAHPAAVAAEFEPLVLPNAQTPPFATFFPSKAITDVTRVTPVLTPDVGVYVDAVTELIDGARATLRMQFQYIELPRVSSAASAPLERLVAAIVARQKAGVDVKIIMSQYETAGFLEKLQAAGLDVVHSVKLQSNVHNKGVVVDGARVLVSSQNWSSSGVSTNRDAGVILDSADAADYFSTIFDHDWEHLAQQTASAD